MLTPREAATQTGIDYRTLVDGAKRGVLRCEWAPTSRGNEQPMFDLTQLLEDLAACPCTFPGCNEPAPGRSRRCGKHRARGKPAVELVCQNPSCPRGGEPFTRPRSWLAELDGRGHYCSNPCKGQAIADKELKRRSENGGMAAAAHQVRVDEAAAKLGVTTAALAAELKTSPSVIRATAPAIVEPQLYAFKDDGGVLVAAPVARDAEMTVGSLRLIWPPDSSERYLRSWARVQDLADAEADHWRRYRERYFDVEFMVRQQEALGRLESRADELALRERVAARRKLYLPKRAGRRSDNTAKRDAEALFVEGYTAGDAAELLDYTVNYVSKLWQSLEITPEVKAARQQRRLLELVGGPGSWADFRDVYRALHISAVEARALIDALEAAGEIVRTFDGRRVILQRVSLIVE